MSIVEKHVKAVGKIVNVEDILANFFLKKIGMEDSKTENDYKCKKKSKHKKHKSKKYKHKSRERSNSSEKEISDNLSICSSEEKDIERLKKIKKLDLKDQRKTNPFLPGTLSTQNVLPSNENFIQNNTNVSENINIPYGPSLELLMSGTEMNKSNDELKHSDLSFDRSDKLSSYKLSSMSTSMYSDPKLSSESETLKLTEIADDGKEYKEGNASNNIEMPSDKLLNTSKQIASMSELKVSDAVSIGMKPESIDVKRKVSPEKYRSRSRSNSGQRLRTRSYSSRSRSRNRSSSGSRSNYRSRKERSHSREYSKSQHASQSKARRSNSRSRSKRSRRSYSRSRQRDRRSRSSSYSKDYVESKNIKRRSPSSSRRYRSRSREKEQESHRLEREAICTDRSNTKSSYEKESKWSRSRSKEKYSTTKSCKIDQAKIREIAEKNVLNMIQQGTLPESISIEQFKKKELVSIKAGGKSVQELTDFCAKLSKKENDVNEDSHDNDDFGNLEGEKDFIHHPFKLKEQPVIRLNIRNAVQIPVKTHAEKFAETAKLSSQFPVSSGNQHKQKELEWIPVVPEKNKNDTQLNAVKSAIPIKLGTSTGNLATPKTVESDKASLPLLPISSDIPSIPLPSAPSEPMPLPPPPPLPLPFRHLPTPPVSSFQLLPSNVAVQSLEMRAPCTSNAISQSVSYPTLPVATCHSSQISSTSVSRPYFSNRTVSTSTSQFDFAALFSKKFQAEQKLHGDPSNTEALKAIQEAEAALRNWVNSCKVPGMFYGNTHIKPLPREKLGGFKDYRVKKDTFIRAAPVTEGKGMSLLKKMGWNPGEGLGKNKEGALIPLLIDIKMDKKGLVSKRESGKNNMTNAVKELQGKHPVSALMELCSKRKWKPPLYTVIKDTGPPHKKQFLFKVEVNGIDYQSVMPSSNKKVAKADSAIVCLQALKLFPA